MTQLQRDSPLPLNYQLSKKLETEIVELRWQIGSKIPSVRELTVQYGVSMPVVRQALQHLASEGVIETLHGKGSFVRKRPVTSLEKASLVIVFMLPEMKPLSMSYFLRVLPEIEKVAAACDLSVELKQHNDNTMTQKSTSNPLGVIWCGPADSDYVRQQLERNIPVVAIGDGPDLKRLTRIVNDDFEGGYIAGKHLMNQGHRNVGALIRKSELTYARRRFAGFKHAVEEFDNATVDMVAIEQHDPLDVACKMLSKPDRPTAIFGTSDRLAHTILRAATQMNIQVPNELSLIGFGDDPFAEFLIPPLTTIRTNQQQMGKACIQAILDKHHDASVTWSSEIKLQVQLVERSSTTCK